MNHASNSWIVDPSARQILPHKSLEEVMKELEMQKTYESKTDRCEHCDGSGRRSLDRVEVLVTLDDDEKVIGVQTTPEVWDHISKISKPQKDDKVTITFEGVDVVFSNEKQDTLPSAHPEEKVYPNPCEHFEGNTADFLEECSRCGFHLYKHTTKLDQPVSPEVRALEDYYRRIKDDPDSPHVVRSTGGDHQKTCTAFVWPYDGKNKNCGRCGKTYNEHLHEGKE